jgi:ATP-dependent phosphofructokinase / diphosphate-dependent phosphofructokinase
MQAPLESSKCARRHPDRIGKVLAGRNGIISALYEDLIDTSFESDKDIARLRYTPGGAFSSRRHKLKSIEQNRAGYERLIEVFATHDIGYFFYNGGGDSQDTSHKVAQLSLEVGYPMQCIGIPKTIDNDLPSTDNCPGFGSVAKYVATSIREAAFDLQSMAATPTKIFVLEVKGRHAGWIAAAGALAAQSERDAPQIVVLPEVAFDQQRFLARVKDSVDRFGYCALVVSEGAHYADGSFLADSGEKDAFEHAQLGGVAPVLARLINTQLSYKFHWAVADYLQRTARHIASATDVEQAYRLGEAAVELALDEHTAEMPIIRRLADEPYRWDISHVPLEKVANLEKTVPPEFISADGFGITPACRRYLAPLIISEDPPPYVDGLPDYVRLKNVAVERRIRSAFSL